MAKNRNKKKRSDAVSMDIAEPSVSDMPQAMGTSECGVLKPVPGMLNIKIKKGRPMKRLKNVRKKKAVAKAISNREKYVEKTPKKAGKSFNFQSGKSLYD